MDGAASGPRDPRPDVGDPRSAHSSNHDVAEYPSTAMTSIRQHVFHEPHGWSEWLRMPELPSGIEIMVSQAGTERLPRNRIDTAWPSKDDYLETHYRLLRREGTEALRYAVNSYIASPASSDNEDMCIYTKVRVVGYLMTRLGPLCRITFSTERAKKKILWQQSRRLIPGSVLAISTKRDNFTTICITATVARRPYRDGLDQNPPQVDIIWGIPSEYVISPDEELIMIEARSGYFEAVRHTLVGLQMAATAHSPLFKYVVDGDKSDALASFVYNDPDRDLSGCLSQAASASTAEWLKNYDVREPMPDIRGQTSMDETQFHALYRMLTKELCIVQGPPGTGKTFTSVEAIRIMLANQAPADPPIIVAAQTNHALDQLLGLCLDVGARIVRVGGRTESERIEEHTIFNARQQVRSNVESFFKALDARRSRACTAMIELTEKVFNETLLQPADLLNADVITKEQHDSLIDDEMEGTEKHSLHGPFSLWLSGDCIEADVVRNKYCDDKKLTGDDEEFNQQEYEFEDDFENLAEEDEDKDRIHGTFIPFSYKWTGTEPAHLSSGHKRVVRELNKADLYAIPKYLRGAVYRLLIDRYIEKLRPQLLQCFADYIQCCKEGKMYRWMRDVNVVKQLQVNVVGCTTTGLTKYRGFLAALGAKTMLVEEAAETRESNITSALYPSIQQLILVGDHMQLAPSCDVRWLGQKPYYLGMSMFERMVAHVHLPYIMLDKQRRMAPEIRAVMDHFYDGLVDHPVVLRRDPVPGMGDRRTWLFAHKWEDAVDANHSRYNAEEATMVVNFFAYLVNNGIKEKQITVLTFYNAQRRMILKKLNTHPSLGAKEEPYHVHTVDSYQGEENDIVLLSLVRSPAAHREYAVGFLDNRNRVIVAISRARRGFYMFGNMVNASKASVASGEIWNPIWHAFIDQGSYDRARGLPLQCQPHGKTIWIKNTDGWTDNTGGCDQRCNFVRECGHTCPFPCHVKPHDQIRCGQVCGKTLTCGHVCQKWCKDTCNCVCPAFQALKTQNESRRQLRDHQEMHMSLEELLLAEAADDPQPVVEQLVSEDMQIAMAKPAPSRNYAAVAGPGVVARLKKQQQPNKLGPVRGRQKPKSAKLTGRHPTQKLVQPPQERAGPIVRPPPLLVQQPGMGQLNAVAHRYQNFVRNIDKVDLAHLNARRASLAETAGQEPRIRDNYRPVKLVDGRRFHTPSNSSPEKESSNAPSGQSSSSSRVTSPTGSNMATASIPRLQANGNVNVRAFNGIRPYKIASPGTFAQSGTRAAARANGSGSRQAPSLHSPTRQRPAGQRVAQSETHSSAITNGNSIDSQAEGGGSDTTSTEATDGAAGKTSGTALLDILEETPAPDRLIACEANTTKDEDLYADLVDVFATRPAHSHLEELCLLSGVPGVSDTVPTGNGYKNEAKEEEKEKGEEKEKKEALLIDF